MNNICKASLFFGLGIVLNTGALLLLQPWVIVESVVGSEMPVRQIWGYGLLVATLLANLLAAIQFCRWRGWQFTGVSSVKKVTGVVAGLVLASILFAISYTCASIFGQLLAQS